MLKLVVLNTNMEYGKYLELQTRLEWLYDFHPDFFDDISPEDKKVLQEAFLYDTPDEEYPDSIEDFLTLALKMIYVFSKGCLWLSGHYMTLLEPEI